jgi:hypothetical protein
MNKHVTPLEHDRKTDGSAPRHAEIAREEASRSAPSSNRRPTSTAWSNTIDEPYTGDDHHDPALRKAKVAAAIALLGTDPNQAFKLRLGDAALSKRPAVSILLASGLRAWPV